MVCTSLSVHFKGLGSFQNAVKTLLNKLTKALRGWWIREKYLININL